MKYKNYSLFIIQYSLLLILFPILVNAEFLRDNTNDIVLDTTTNLTWEDRGETSSSTYTWVDAIDYCKNLTHGGLNDWRLPNINELETIIDDKKYNPAIKDIFVNTASFNYWSSTTYAGNASYAWYVYFSYGSTYYYNNKTSSRYVRCVRSGQ